MVVVGGGTVLKVENVVMGGEWAVWRCRPELGSQWDVWVVVDIEKRVMEVGVGGTRDTRPLHGCETGT